MLCADMVVANIQKLTIFVQNGNIFLNLAMVCLFVKNHQKTSTCNIFICIPICVWKNARFDNKLE